MEMQGVQPKTKQKMAKEYFRIGESNPELLGTRVETVFESERC